LESKALALDVRKNNSPKLKLWTPKSPIIHGSVLNISQRSVGRFLHEADLQPHRIRGWLTPKPDEKFEEKCHDICKTYEQALEREKKGEKTISIDEMTGIQALERDAPTLPMKPGKPECQEFEYVRHGTQTLIAGFDVATGHIFGEVGETRTEEDLARFISNLLNKEQNYKKFHLVADNLNTHISESIVRIVA